MKIFGWVMGAIVIFAALSAMVARNDNLKSHEPGVVSSESPTHECFGPDKHRISERFANAAEFKATKYKSSLSNFIGADEDGTLVYDSGVLFRTPMPFAVFSSRAECVRIALALPIREPISAQNLARIDCETVKALRDEARHYTRAQINVIAEEIFRQPPASPESKARRMLALYDCFNAAP